MQNKFTRIDNRLAMVMEEPIKPKKGKFINSTAYRIFAYDEAVKEYEKQLKKYNSRPSYPINHADLDKFEEGKQYEKDKHFYLDYSDPINPTAFPLPTPNDRREKGELNGECNRTACDNKNAIYFNKSTKAYYCKDCADLINKYNVADTVRVYGVPYLCEAVTTNKNDRREEKQKEESDAGIRLERTIDYIKRNLSKINEHTWKVYKEQALAHIEDAEYYIKEIINHKS